MTKVSSYYQFLGEKSEKSNRIFTLASVETARGHRILRVVAVVIVLVISVVIDNEQNDHCNFPNSMLIGLGYV